MSEEEIRLIKGYFNDQYCCDIEEIKDIANKMIRENWRLNNIIINIENILKTEQNTERFRSDYNYGVYNTLDYIFCKLQEFKKENKK